MNQLTYWLNAYRLCLPADYYIFRLVDASEKRITQPREYPYSKLLKCDKFLAFKNRQGYHIYGRPEGLEYILIDDIKKDKLPLLMKQKPSLVMETSPDNFQAYLRLPFIPVSRQHAVNLCREACAILVGDRGSAEPDHVGRIPGFLNLKPEHMTKEGSYPRVILHYAEDQYSTFSPQGRQDLGGVSPLRKRERAKNTTVDRSREDFAFACQLWKAGKKRGEVEYEIGLREKGRNRPDYVKRTVEAAYKKVKSEGRLPN